MLLIIRGNVYKKVYNGAVMNNLMNKMLAVYVLGEESFVYHVHPNEPDTEESITEEDISTFVFSHWRVGLLRRTWMFMSGWAKLIILRPSIPWSG